MLWPAIEAYLTTPWLCWERVYAAGMNDIQAKYSHEVIAVTQRVDPAVWYAEYFMLLVDVETRIGQIVFFSQVRIYTFIMRP